MVRRRITGGIKLLIIGAVILTIALILMHASAKAARAVFILQIVGCVIGGFLIFRGLLMLISGFVKNEEDVDD
ncbi:MAG: hypothetical protein J6Y82_12415 [Bacteroidales bacterium]|nr:hypothetical protein [Bacteroidales bacterium]